MARVCSPALLAKTINLRNACHPDQRSIQAPLVSMREWLKYRKVTTGKSLTMPGNQQLGVSTVSTDGHASYFLVRSFSSRGVACRGMSCPALSCLMWWVLACSGVFGVVCDMVWSGCWTKPAEARVLLTKTFQPGQPVPWRFKPGAPATITWIEVVSYQSLYRKRHKKPQPQGTAVVPRESTPGGEMISLARNM